MRNVSFPMQNIYSSMQILRKAQAEFGYGIAGDGYKSKPRRSSVELRRGLLNNYIIKLCSGFYFLCFNGNCLAA